MARTLTSAVDKYNLLSTVTIASSTASAQEKETATYVATGTADQTVINTALNAVKAAGGGTVKLGAGVFNLTDTIYMEGVNTPDDTAGLELVGAGNGNTTRLIPAANITPITLRYMPQVAIRKMQIYVNGTGDGIKAIGNTTGDNDRRGFWNSTFEDLYFIGQNNHSGWCMNLESPFRSSFKRLGTGNGINNGIWIKSHYANFNPGNCTFEVIQMGLSNANGTAYRIESADNGGFMNILNFTECDSIDTNGSSTSSIGWYFKGSSTSYFTVRDVRVIGANPEQFNTALKIEKGANIRFLGDFINPKSGGYVADLDSGSVNNRIEVEYIYINGTSSVNAFRDLNTDALKPNYFVNSFARVESGGTLTISPSTASQIFNLARDSDGSGVYPTIWTSDYVKGAHTYADTISMLDGANIDVGSTTGSMIGTNAADRIGFLGNAPIAKQGATVDLGTVLSNFGLRTGGTAFPLTTSGNVAFTGNVRWGNEVRTAATATLGTSSKRHQLCNATAQPITVSLPSTTTPDLEFVIKKTDASANTVTISSTSIDGQATRVLSTQYASLTVISTTTAGTWYII